MRIIARKSFLWSSFSVTKEYLILIYQVFLAIFDSLCIFFLPKKNKPDKNKILVIRLDAIGDFILWLDTAKELERLFPKDICYITLLGNQAWISLAEDLPYFDEVWPLDRNRFFNSPAYRFKMFKGIREAGFDKAIQPTLSREFFYGDAIVRASGAKERIGSQGDLSNISPWQKRISDRWYTRLIPASKSPLMELERNAEFLRGLGLTSFRGAFSNLNFFIRDSSDVRFKQKNYFVVFVGAKLKNRQWPLYNFKELVMRICKNYRMSGLICGGDEEKVISRIFDDCEEIRNMVGKTSLKDLISIVAGARLVISNESCAIHIAAATSTSSVCILGGGQYGRFLPYPSEMSRGRPLPVAISSKMNCFNCNWRCVYNIKKEEPFPCVKNITVNEVWELVRNVLG